MSSELDLLLVVENDALKELSAEHGLAFWIDYKGEQYLFDTGQGLALMDNLAKLNLAPTDLTGLVISHGYYDHGGGLVDILNQNPVVPVYAHPDIFLPKYSKNSSGMISRGFAVNRAFGRD